MIEVDWETFQNKYLVKKRIFVIEEDDKWILHCADEIWKIKCVVEKMEDQAENIMFVERYFSNLPNIIKVMSMGEEDEVEEEELEQYPENVILVEEEVAELNVDSEVDELEVELEEIEEVEL